MLMGNILALQKQLYRLIETQYLKLCSQDITNLQNQVMDLILLMPMRLIFPSF